MVRQEDYTVHVCEKLRKAAGFPATGKPLNYFELLGVSPQEKDPSQLKKAMRERIRALRQWQHSPEVGDEVVRLLPLLHRVVRILSDDRRREMYVNALQQPGDSDTQQAQNVFVEKVRASLAVDDIDDASRSAELSAMAQSEGLAPHEADAIIQRVRNEMQGRLAEQRGKTQSELGGDWEFRIAGEGEESFLLMLSGMHASGNFDEKTNEEWMREGARYGLEPQRAHEMVLNFQCSRFEETVARAAGNLSLSEVQTDMLRPLGLKYGLTEQQVNQIFSDYTISLNTQFEENFEEDEEADDFRLSQSDNESFIEGLSGELPPDQEKVRTAMTLPGWLSHIALLALVVFVVGIVGWWASINMRDNNSNLVEHKERSETEQVAQPEDVVEKVLSQSYSLPSDPDSGLIRFEPETQEDPPAFIMKTTEVTCEEYRTFLKETQTQPPLGWTNRGEFPEGWDALPVTQLTYHEATAFCAWIAQRKGWDVKQVTLPSHAEWERAARGKTMRGNPLADNYWREQKFNQIPRLKPVTDNISDKIIIEDKGHMYDLIGNASEWGRDVKDGRQSILGGNVDLASTGFDPRKSRWQLPGIRGKYVGFRYVILSEVPTETQATEDTILTNE